MPVEVPVEVNNSPIELHLPAEAKEKRAIVESKPSPVEVYSSVSIKHGLRTTDYGLRTGCKTRTGYKTRTEHYGLGIKYGLGYKMRTEHYGLGIKHGLGYKQAHMCTGCKLYPLFSV